MARKKGGVNYYKNGIDFLVVPYIPIPARAAWQNKAEAVALDLEQPWSAPSFRISLEYAGLTVLLGLSSEPKTLHAGADRKGRVCQAQVGTRIQGFLGLDRWIHESPGPPPI